MSKRPARERRATLVRRPFTYALIGAVVAVALAILGYSLASRRSTESLQTWVERQNFVFLVPARSGLLPGDIIQWPAVTPGAAPTGDPELYKRSVDVLDLADESEFVRTGPFDVTLSGSVDAGLRAGAFTPEVAAQAKASGAEDFELVMKDVFILEAPISELQDAIGRKPALLQALRNPNRTVVSRVLRPAHFHYRFSASGETGFAANFKRLLGGKGQPGVQGGGTFKSAMEVKSDIPLVIGFALAKLDLAEASSSALAAPVRTLKFEESRGLQTDGNAVLWPVGSTIKVGFMDRAPAREALFKEAMGEWLKYANLKVAYVDPANADVRVKFPSNFESWSYVGTKALRVNKDQPTIVLGYGAEAPDARMRYLHEIGHVFGLVHEFQNPQMRGLWNREAVFAYYSRPPNYWSKAAVETNFFEEVGYPGSRPVDYKSVMGFPIPPGLIRGGSSFEPGSDLSASDRAYIAQLYSRDEG